MFHLLLLYRTVFFWFTEFSSKTKMGQQKTFTRPCAIPFYFVADQMKRAFYIVLHIGPGPRTVDMRRRVVVNLHNKNKKRNETMNNFCSRRVSPLFLCHVVCVKTQNVCNPLKILPYRQILPITFYSTKEIKRWIKHSCRCVDNSIALKLFFPHLAGKLMQVCKKCAARDNQLRVFRRMKIFVFQKQYSIVK